MKESLRGFTINLFILALIILAVGYGLFFFVIPDQYFVFFPAVPLFVFVVTAIVHIYLVNASQNDARKFAAKYLGSMGAKLLLYIIFIAIFLAINIENSIPFLVSFLVSYMTFTIVEVIAIMKYQKRS